MGRKKSSPNKKRTKSAKSKVPIEHEKFRFSSLFSVSDNVTGEGSRHQWHALITFITIFAVYLITMPTLVTYEDEGIFNLLCHYGQPMHPPGYPLYSVLCYPFTNLPFLSITHWGNILSALFGALACSTLYLIAVHWIGSSYIYGYLAGLSFGFSRLFWSQSIIQEVYTLHTFLVLMTLLITLVYVEKRNPKILKWIALSYGLSLANHWPMVVLISPALLVLLLPIWKDFWEHIKDIKVFIKLLSIVVGVGVFPYFYVWAMSHYPGPVNFYGALTSWNDFVYYVMRSGYSGVDNQASSLFEKMLFVKFLVTGIWMQFGYIFVPFLVLGFIAQWARWHWSRCLSLILLYVGTSYLILIFLNFRYTDLFESVFSVYQITSYIAFAIWGTLGIKVVIDWLSDKFQMEHGVFQGIALLLTSLLVVSVLLTNFASNNRSSDRFAHDTAKVILDSFEPNAVILTYNDFQMPLIKEQVIKKLRPDITLYNTKGLVLSNRYVSPIASRKEKKKQTINLINSIKDRPIYEFSLENYGYGFEDHGIYRKVRKDWKEGKSEIIASPKLFQLWDLTDIKEDDIPFDIWVKRITRSKLVNTLIKTTQPIEEEFKLQYYRRLSGGNFYDILSLMKYIFQTNSEIKGIVLSQLAEKAEGLIPENIQSRDLADFVSAKAFALYSEAPKDYENMQRLIDGLSESMEIYPASDNSAIYVLLQVYSKTNEKAKFNKLVKNHPAVLKNHSVKQYKDKFDKELF